MSFFEPPPPLEPCPEPAQPEWIGPPEGVLGGVLALQLLIARTEDVLLAASNIAVYPNGIAFELYGLVRAPAPRGRHHRGLLWDDGEPETILRIGVLYPDGRRASNLNRRFPEADAEPARPILIEQGGSAGDRSFRQGYWLWPAPPAGPLVLVAEWLAHSVPESRATIGAGPIEEARSRILEVWPSGPSGGGWTSRTDLFGGSEAPSPRPVPDAEPDRGGGADSPG